MKESIIFGKEVLREKIKAWYKTAPFPMQNRSHLSLHCFSPQQWVNLEEQLYWKFIDEKEGRRYKLLSKTKEDEREGADP